MPNGLEKILTRAFKNCVNLKVVNIPDTVTKIGNSAFEGCTALEKIYVEKGSYAEQWAKDNGLESKLAYK